MDISIFGLGYVGAVCAGCLSQRGHRVIGCDVQDAKVNAINNGSSPIGEPGLGELIRAAHAASRLSATRDSLAAVRDSSISLICVGTPSTVEGGINLVYLQAVCKEIGQAVAKVNRPHTVVIRSTVAPNAIDETLIPALKQAAGDAAGNLHFAVNPEFLREGTAIADFDHPPMIVIGSSDKFAADAVAATYQGIDAPIFHVGLKEAVMVKYACNLYHALKIIFGNEIGAICQAGGIDSHKVMDVFCQDKQLNISHRYLKPGFAYGGSCLPKDLRAILYFARHRNVEVPVLSAIGASNVNHVNRCVQAVVNSGARRVGVLGLSFKDDTDDLRESPAVEIVERLIGKGLAVAIHDKDVAASKIFGSNLMFVQQHLPHIASLMRPTPPEAVAGAEVVLLCKASKTYADLAAYVHKDQTLIDLVRYFQPGVFTACKYVGLVG